MKLGLFHSVQWPEGSDQQDRYRQALEQALFAEEAGFESIWFTEHHFSRHGIVSDSLNVLAYLAARTSRVRLGTAVAVLPFHDPVRLAESSAIVDLLSGGRLDFGVGLGFQWSEFHGFNVGMDEREARFDEATAILRRAWTSDRPFSFEGRFWQYNDVDPQPKPVQQPHPPIWLATNNEAGFRRCVQEDWGLMISQGRPLAVVADEIARYRKLLDEAGKPFDPAKVILARGMYAAESDAAAWADSEQPYRRFQALAAQLSTSPQTGKQTHNPYLGAPLDVLKESVVFGSPDTCVEMLRRIAELGIEQVICFVHLGTLPHEKIMASMRLFASEVMPAVAETAAPAR